jgi:AcrR family transcriptional regulator
LGSSETYQKILDAAAHVFNEMGYANATLDDVGVRVGLNRASMYYYVSTKAELLADVLRPMAEMTPVVLRKLQEDGGSATEKLQRIVRLHHQIWEQNYPNLMLLLQHDTHIEEPGTRKMMVAATRQWRNALESILDEGIASGEFRKDLDVHLYTRILLALCNGTREWWQPGKGATLRDVAEVYADMAVRGVSASENVDRRQHNS